MNYDQTTDEWEDSHKYSPAPRHRRRIIKKLIKELPVNSILDAGCAQPFLLNSLKEKEYELYGCDISKITIDKNKTSMPTINFEVVDLAVEAYPNNEKFDLVICSEVIEHIEKWPIAIKNLVASTNKYLLITVPSGEILPIDQKVGHVHHFTKEELHSELEKNGMQVIKSFYWGFPFHKLYKYLINHTSPDKIYNNFSVKKYGPIEKSISFVIYYLFYVNDLFSSGNQLILLAKINNN